MKLLHLSDLHVTERDQDLETLWVGPRRIVAGQRFDAVIVSGDLTQRAGEDEYKKVEAFATAELLPLVPDSDPRRIIFVPGNHDVDWETDVSMPRPFWRRIVERLPGWRSQARREYDQEPCTSGYRITDGGIAPVDINHDRYRRRLQGCHAFLSRFYKPGGAGLLHRPFDLLKPHGDWSVHQFVGEKVAIFGFNSCHGNDKYWKGARIDRRSIAAAAAYRDQQCQGYLPLAVWHHGLTARQGHPDYLGMGDLAALQDAGFRIGFHGHVHEDMSHVLQLLREEFVLVATGSLAAGEPDRPGVGQQFSIVDLHPPTRLKVTTYERRFAGKQYEPSAGRMFYLRPRRNRPNETRCGTHRRSWIIDSYGIAKVSVDMTDLEGAASLVLGHLNPPFCNFEFDEKAFADGDQLLQVTSEPQNDGRCRFLISEPRNPHRELHWGYSVSNSVALYREELNLFEPIGSYFGNVPDGFQICCHTVRHECDQLVLRLEFKEKVGGELPQQPGLENVRAIVESKSGDEEWQREPDEERRCTITPGIGKGRFAELSVTAPVAGLRYGLLFQPVALELPYPRQAKHLEASLLNTCRKGGNPSRASELLTQCVRRQVLNALDIPRDEVVYPDVVWMGLLWEPVERRLLPAFGEFAAESWGCRFAAGNGIAGHAFRTSGTTVWWQNEGPSHLLYQDRVEPYGLPLVRQRGAASGERRYSWIVCLPLVIRGGRSHSVGVVSFAGRTSKSRLGKELEGLAHRASAQDPSASATEKALRTAVNVGFWDAVKEEAALELNEADRRLGAEFLLSNKVK